MQAILCTWGRKHTQRLSILCGFEPEKHRRAILAHNVLRKLEEATDESLEGKGNRKVEVMKQWIRWQSIAKARSRKDLVHQVEGAEDKYSKRIATKHLGSPTVRCIFAKGVIEYMRARVHGAIPKKPRSRAETLGGLGVC